MPADPFRQGREHDLKAQPSSRQDLLFVVARAALDHYERLKGTFAQAHRVLVILDRRYGERRQAPRARRRERRRADRRSRSAVDVRLRRHGWAIVRLEDIPTRNE